MAEVRPFRVAIADEALRDVQARLNARRRIEDIYGGDWAYGVPLPFVEKLCAHWTDAFDWRAFEARINRQPQIVTDIDGLTIHAIDRRSTRADAVPLLMLHGWPSSFLEFLDIVDPLAEPPADRPAFHVVVPSLPGYGFSATRPGTTPQRIAGMLVELMARLGHARFMIQGGNWGSLIGTEIARQFSERVIGLHLNSINGSPPADRDSIVLAPEEQSWVDDHSALLSFPHFALLTQKPTTPAHALNDSPAGLVGWVGEKLHDWADNEDGRGLPLDWMVGTIALYWFTQTIGSSSLLYYELVHDMPQERFVAVPTGVAIPARELVKIPRPWAERHYNIVHWTHIDHGGHYAAVEVPEPFVRDIRAFADFLQASGM